MKYINNSLVCFALKFRKSNCEYWKYFIDSENESFDVELFAKSFDNKVKVVSINFDFLSDKSLSISNDNDANSDNNDVNSDDNDANANDNF